MRIPRLPGRWTAALAAALATVTAGAAGYGEIPTVAQGVFLSAAALTAGAAAFGATAPPKNESGCWAWNLAVTFTR